MTTTTLSWYQFGETLFRPRGDIVWSGIVRGTGIAGAISLAVMGLAPVVAPLVGFLVVTVWVNGPIGILLPATYEPILMAFGRVYPPLLIGFLGIVGTVYVEYLNYRLYDTVLGSRALAGLTQSGMAKRVTTLFSRAPFFTVWLCSWSPLPYWLVRILSPMANYPVRRHLLATFLGRFPRLWFFAALGVYWKVDLGVVFGISTVAVAVAVMLAIRSSLSARSGQRSTTSDLRGLSAVS